MAASALARQVAEDFDQPHWTTELILDLAILESRAARGGLGGPASPPLGDLVEVPPEWMLDLMIDLYQVEVRGAHGFGLCHPRAPWLRLVVTDREECDCDALGCWEDAAAERREDGTRVLYCRRCADAEIALNAAERLRRQAVPRAVHTYETEPTVVEAPVPMAMLAGSAS
jgi:hypothetical protein